MSLPGQRTDLPDGRDAGRQPSAAGADRQGPRVALVTGAARRIGREIALALADAGWDIGVHYRQSRADAEETVAAIRARGRRALCLEADLSVEAQVDSLLPRLAAELGPVAAVVNNASRFQQDDIGSFDTSGLMAHLLPNLAAPLLLARALAAQLPQRTRGVVVNLLDQKLYNPNPDFLSYTLSKAALRSATTLLAQALAPRIRVFGVAPGLSLPSYLQDEEAFADAHRRYSPLGRSSTAADIASAVVFGIGNQAVTGSVLLVDGGQHLMPLSRDVSLIDRPADAAARPSTDPAEDPAN